MLVGFFRNEVSHPSGAFLNEILLWDDEKWEDRHDFIQWVFPTFKQSAFNSDVPELTKADVKTFREDPDIQESLAKVAGRFFEFLEPHFPGHPSSHRAPWWFHPQDHNLLRITRALDSLKTLSTGGQEAVFIDWLRGLQDTFPGVIPERTKAFWEEAVK